MGNILRETVNIPTTTRNHPDALGIQIELPPRPRLRPRALPHGVQDRLRDGVRHQVPHGVRHHLQGDSQFIEYFTLPPLYFDTVEQIMRPFESRHHKSLRIFWCIFPYRRP